MDNSIKNSSSGKIDESIRNSLLIAQQGPLEGQRWNIQSGLLIGRAPDCDIQITDRQVSRFHARISPEENQIELEDLGSKNGTYVGDEPLSGKVAMRDGMVFSVALIQKFVYYLSDATMPLEDISSLQEYKQKGLLLDKKSRRVWVGKQEIVPPLSVPQFKLLETLYDQPGVVISREELIEKIWENEQSEGVSDQALDALIRRLRERLLNLDPDFEYILTVRGHGLRFQNH